MKKKNIHYIIFSQRTILRIIENQDYTSILKTICNPLVANNIYFIPKTNQDIFVKNWIKRAKNDFICKKGLLMTVTDKKDNYIGNIALHYENNLHAEIGYWFSPDSWGKGYATEILKSVIDYTKSLKMNSLYASVAKDNIASQKVLEKCEFTLKEEKIFLKQDGTERPSYIFEIKLKDN